MTECPDYNQEFVGKLQDLLEEYQATIFVNEYSIRIDTVMNTDQTGPTGAWQISHAKLVDPNCIQSQDVLLESD